MARYRCVRSSALSQAQNFVLQGMPVSTLTRKIILLLALNAVPVVAAPAPRPAPPALLPPSFAGLQTQGAVSTQSGNAAALVDPAHAALLREDGLLDTSSANYMGAGAKLAVRAYRFGDATGAYAAFTAFRDQQMRSEVVGAEGAAAGDRHLFWSGATLVDATAAPTTVHTLAHLQALAASLPRTHGPAAIAPPVRGYLPSPGLIPESVHYAIGPAGYAGAGGVLPVSVIDFSREAEVLTARYKTPSGTAGFTLITYPTPQMAANRVQAIDTLLKGGGLPVGVGDPGVISERIGPLIAFTSGGLSADAAHRLIRSVHYEAQVTINHPEGYVSEVSKTAKLLLGIAYLTGVLAVASVLLALFLGGGRILLRRMRGKPASSMHDEDFISLKL